MSEKSVLSTENMSEAVLSAGADELTPRQVIDVLTDTEIQQLNTREKISAIETIGAVATDAVLREAPAYIRRLQIRREASLMAQYVTAVRHSK